MLTVQRLASEVIAAVLSGRSLPSSLQAAGTPRTSLSASERGALQDICYGVLRHYGELSVMLDALLRAPLRDDKLRTLVLAALYQLRYTRAAPHAVVDHAVQCAAALGQAAAKPLVNAVLRNFLRRQHALAAAAAGDELGRYSHPRWWIRKLGAQYPREHAAIMDAGNQHAPLTLRINARRISAADYLALLEHSAMDGRMIGPQALMLERAVPVERIPGFAQGLVSVQDAGAQWAAPLLDARPGQRVLDACAAPGGKTAHLLELADVDLRAVDDDAARLQRVPDNLERLSLSAEIQCADVTALERWWDGRPFDRILCDAPCSASGVVRRHPDIKWLRREADIARFASTQTTMLEALWQALATDGKLLYVTCSVFHEENRVQVARFLERHDDATLLPVAIPQANDGQLLPEAEHDGFFYALIGKR